MKMFNLYKYAMFSTVYFYSRFLSKLENMKTIVFYF